MLYLLQDKSESNALQIEIEELKIALDEYAERHPATAHKYRTVTSGFFKNCDYTHEWMRKNTIPVGSIEFVATYLKEFYNIHQMNPIEVPICLRLQHILLRKYDIVPYEEIPCAGNYFIKDVSVLKGFSYSGETHELLNNTYHEEINKSHLFQVSTLLNILAEYRVFVMNNKIIGIQFYDGNPTIMPTEKEINKIKEIILRWSMDKHCPQAYTMDVAIINNPEQKRDLSLIECHPFVAVGTYGCRGAFLPMMFKLGLQWYINHNTPIS